MAYQRVRGLEMRVRIRRLEVFVFSENLTCFVFLKHPFWDSPFCLITDDLLKKSSIKISQIFSWKLSDVESSCSSALGSWATGLIATHQITICREISKVLKIVIIKSSGDHMYCFVEKANAVPKILEMR